jgi:hypothetical protein
MGTTNSLSCVSASPSVACKTCSGFFFPFASISIVLLSLLATLSSSLSFSASDTSRLFLCLVSFYACAFLSSRFLALDQILCNDSCSVACLKDIIQSDLEAAVVMAAA